jgi:short-subunit dehydrogenase
MKNLRGKNAILTGANGGLGSHLALALAQEGVNLLLVGYPGVGLEDVQTKVTQLGAKSFTLVADLSTRGGRDSVVKSALSKLGSIELLINNAGVEYNSEFHTLSPENLRDVIAVNLEAPMNLTQQLLPHMLSKGEGHIVNLSSLAGKSGPAMQEPYAATKAALSAFTLSLRSSYRGTGVSASAITPGFIETGIYSRLKARSGRSAPFLLGACSPNRVCRALIHAIQHDSPEIILNRFPIRPALALALLFPRFGEWMVRVIGVHRFFRHIAESEARHLRPPN